MSTRRIALVVAVLALGLGAAALWFGRGGAPGAGDGDTDSRVVATGLPSPALAAADLAAPAGRVAGRGAVPASGAPPVRPLAPRPLRNVVVRVLGGDGAPIRDVGVRVPSSPDGWNDVAAGTTDVAGEVTLGVPGAGEVAVEVAPPWGPKVRAIARSGERGVAEATIRLPSGEIEGVVRLLDGTPVAVDLVLERLTEFGDYVYCTGTSGADGRFAFRHVPDAEFLVRARPRDEWDRLGTGESARPTQGSVSLWVVSSKEADAMRPRFRLVDAVTGASVGLGPLVDVSARHLDGPSRGVSVDVDVDSDGPEFVARHVVPPGTYRLEIWRAGYVPAVLDGVVFPRVGPPAEVRLRHGATVKGRFSDGQGEPAFPGTVSIGPVWTPLSHDGTYELDGVGPGAAEVVFDSEPTGAVRVSATIPTEGEVVVDARGPPGGVLLVDFDDDPSLSLDLRVEPVAGGAALTPRKRESAHVWVAAPLPVGRYRVRCVFDGLELPAREVDVRDGEETDLTFEVPAARR